MAFLSQVFSGGYTLSRKEEIITGKKTQCFGFEAMFCCFALGPSCPYVRYYIGPQRIRIVHSMLFTQRLEMYSIECEQDEANNIVGSVQSNHKVN